MDAVVVTAERVSNRNLVKHLFAKAGKLLMSMPPSKKVAVGMSAEPACPCEPSAFEACGHLIAIEAWFAAPQISSNGVGGVARQSTPAVGVWSTRPPAPPFNVLSHE